MKRREPSVKLNRRRRHHHLTPALHKKSRVEIDSHGSGEVARFLEWLTVCGTVEMPRRQPRRAL